jgi:hypothetical protein
MNNYSLIFYLNPSVMKKIFTTILFITSFLFFKSTIAGAQINTQDSLALIDPL